MGPEIENLRVWASMSRDVNYLRRDDDAHVAQIHIDSSQVFSIPRTAGQDRYFRQILKCFPFSPDIIYFPNYDYMLNLMEVKV